MLIVGGSSLLGQRLALLAVKQYEVFATYNQHPVLPVDERIVPVHLDITAADKVSALVEQISPQVVVHAAAWVDADACEQDRFKAYRINVEGTRNVAQASAECQAELVFVSSDYVFDGTKGQYNEEDEPRPISYYGMTKVEGEKLVQALLPDPIICRFTTLYGHNPVRANFVTWVVDNLSQGKEIRVVTDQHGDPTLVDSAAAALLDLLKRQAKGIFHISGRECISRFNFARKIAEVFQLPQELIRPILSQELNQVAPRPKYNCLDVTKTERFLGIKLPTIEEGLLLFREQWPARR